MTTKDRSQNTSFYSSHFVAFSPDFIVSLVEKLNWNLTCVSRWVTFPNNDSNPNHPNNYRYTENGFTRNEFFPVGTISVLSVLVLSVFRWFKIVVFPELSNPTTTIFAAGFLPNPRALIFYSQLSIFTFKTLISLRPMWTYFPLFISRTKSDSH